MSAILRRNCCPGLCSPRYVARTLAPVERVAPVGDLHPDAFSTSSSTMSRWASESSKQRHQAIGIAEALGVTILRGQRGRYRAPLDRTIPWEGSCALVWT